MSLPTEVANLPISVLSRLGGKCTSVTEAEVCTSVALRCGGVRAALYVAASAFIIPTQFDGDYSLSDLLWLVGVLTPNERRGSRQGQIDQYNKDRTAVVHNAMTLEKDVRGNSVWTLRRYNGRIHGCVAVGGSDVFERTAIRLTQQASYNRERLPVRKNLTGDSWKDWSYGCWWASYDSEMDVFPNKYGAKTQKVNVFFADLWRGVREAFPFVAWYLGTHRNALAGMYNDEACAWVTWCCGVWPTLGPAGVALLATRGSDYAFYKSLNTYGKALGVQSKNWGTMVCELGVLHGRGVGGLDMDEDISTRINKHSFLSQKAAVVDGVVLRRIVRKILREEFVEQPRWQSVNEYWTRRWLFTKAGSHQRRVEDRIFGSRLELPSQPTRREFAEACKEPVIAVGEPTTDAGFSAKEEHGKTRAIYGCDSVSYFTFDYLLRPIEDVWRNRYVLLDPGRELQSALYSRLANNRNYKCMADFDDFNSQHTLESMKIVCEEAFADAPHDAKEWAIQSWDNMFINWNAGGVPRRERMVGTLPSGHRATTFVNTVLNAAYCRYAAEELEGLTSYHCGDDVISFGRREVVSEFIVRLDRSPFRLNRAKQSVGRVTGEFLRVAFDERGASGYAARAVSSMVSGNWVTENSLDVKSYIETLVRNVWTLNTRFKCAGIGVLFKYTLMRRARIPGHVANGLLKHEISWNGGPVAGYVTGRPVPIARPSGGGRKVEYQGLAHTYASQDLVNHHVDLKDLAVAGISPGTLKRVLEKASEKPRVLGDEEKLVVDIEWSNKWYSEDAENIARLQSKREKTESEGLNLLRNVLRNVEWERLAGHLRSTSAVGPVASTLPVVCNYTLPYSDCMNFRRKLSHTVGLIVRYPVRV